MIQLKNSKVRDYSHIKSKYRGFFHQIFSASYGLTKNIPFMFHNFGGYISHYVMEQVGKNGEKIYVVLNCLENFIVTFVLGKNLL